MKCERCFYEQETDFEICPACATPVRRKMQSGGGNRGTSPSKKRRISPKRKKVMVRRLSLLVLSIFSVIMIAVVLFGSSEPKFSYPSHSVKAFTDSDNYPAFLFDGETVVRFNTDDSPVSKCALSASGKYAVILTGSGELYLVSKSKCVKFEDADNVYDFVLSPLGETVLYLKDYDTYTGGILSYCDLSSPASSHTVSEGVYSEKNLNFLSSPSGDAFAYVTDYDGQTWTYRITKKGSTKTYRKEKDVYAEAVSDSGKYFYYTDYNGNYTVNGDVICGPENNTSFINVFYDGNATDALVSYDDGGSVYTLLVRSGSIKDDERQKGELSSMLLPSEIASEDGIYWDVDTFVKTAAGIKVDTDEVYYYISGKAGQFKRLFSGVIGSGELYISSDCKTVYFRKDQQSKIKYMKLSDYSGQPEEYDSGAEVAHFRMSKDGKYIYFIDNEGNLYYQKDKSSSVKVYAGINGTDYCVTDSGNVYFGVDYNGTSMQLLFSKHSKDYSKVRTGTEAVELYYSPSSDAVAFLTADGWYSASGGKGSLIR